MGQRLLALVVVVGCAAAGVAHAQDGDARPAIRTIARVIVTGDVDGRFARPVCDASDTLVPSDHAAFTHALMRHAHDDDDPIVIDTGGLLAPNGVARFSMQRRAADLAVMVHELGYRALALGLNDLASPRDHFTELIRELRGHRIPMLASNLRCAEEQMAFCRELVDASDGVSLHMVNGRLTAVMAVLRADATALVSPERARGIVFDDPAETVERLTRMAREAGAEIVIAVVDDHVEGGALGLASGLDPEARPDLIIAANQDQLLFARPQTVRPVLVGAPEGDGVEVLIRESAEIRDGYEFLAQPLEGGASSVAQPVRTWIDRIGEEYCERWGRPLAGARLDTPIDVDGMLMMVARVLRDAAGADIAILNRRALDTRWRPAREGALTASDVFIALEYDEPLQATEVDERWLKRLATNAEERGSIVTPGLTWSGSGTRLAVKVGGHRTESRARYRVVTIRFLAVGGDDEIVPSLGNLGEWEALGDSSLRTTALAYLETPRDQDPRDALPDHEGTLEWVFRADADLTFSGSSINNPTIPCTSDADVPDPMTQDCLIGMGDTIGVVVPDGSTNLADAVPAYSTSQLSLSDVLTFGFNLDFAANAAAPDWTWQNSVNSLYRTTWIEGAADFLEAADQIRGRSTLSWRGLRTQGEDQWYVPDPTIDVFIESEFTQPDTREYHWFLTRPTLGLRFQLFDKLQFQINGGFQVQPLQEQPDPEGGVGGTLTLRPWDIMKLDQRYTRLEFTFDYFLSDLGDRNRGVLRGQLEAAFDLAGPLALMFRFNLLLQHERDRDVGTAINITAGLRIGYLGRSVGP